MYEYEPTAIVLVSDDRRIMFTRVGIKQLVISINTQCSQKGASVLPVQKYKLPVLMYLVCTTGRCYKLQSTCDKYLVLVVRTERRGQMAETTREPKIGHKH